MRFIELLQHVLPHVRCFVSLVQVHAHGDVRVSGREFAHPGPFLVGQVLVLWSELEESTACLVDGVGDAVALIVAMLDKQVPDG